MSNPPVATKTATDFCDANVSVLIAGITGATAMVGSFFTLSNNGSNHPESSKAKVDSRKRNSPDNMKRRK